MATLTLNGLSSLFGSRKAPRRAFSRKATDFVQKAYTKTGGPTPDLERVHRSFTDNEHKRGQDQFEHPKRVNWVSEDGSHARVFGSMTGIPVGELTVTNPPKAPPAARGLSGSSAYAGNDGELNVLLHGNRLEITADVDRAGLERLKEILGKYEEILNIIDPPRGEES